MKNKRAEISTTWIITIILLVIGFSILLFFILKFLWGPSVDRETCHQSVVLRASLPEVMQGFVPLKCKSTKFCISSGLLGGKCDGKGQEFEGEVGITRVRVSSVDEINMFLSREILECWKMYGEGKLSLYSPSLANKFGFGTSYSTCLFCSRIAFDLDSLKKSNIDINQVNVKDYMLTHQAPEQQVSYAQYLAGEKGQIALDAQTLAGVDADNLVTPSMDFNGGQLSILFMQVSAPTLKGIFVNDLKALSVFGVGAGYFFGPKVIIKTLPRLFNVYFVGFMTFVGGAQLASNVYNKFFVINSYCQSFTSGNENREGCTAIRVLKYDPEDISKFCYQIESTP